jgi:hypothetical protein
MQEIFPSGLIRLWPAMSLYANAPRHSGECTRSGKKASRKSPKHRIHADMAIFTIIYIMRYTDRGQDTRWCGFILSDQTIPAFPRACGGLIGEAYPLPAACSLRALPRYRAALSVARFRAAQSRPPTAQSSRVGDYAAEQQSVPAISRRAPQTERRPRELGQERRRRPHKRHQRLLESRRWSSSFAHSSGAGVEPADCSTA